MNERIEKLYEQAHDVEKVWLLPESIRDIGREGEVRTFNPEKFAELIVRECASMADFADKEPGEYVLKHFGLEEE